MNARTIKTLALNPYAEHPKRAYTPRATNPKAVQAYPANMATLPENNLFRRPAYVPGDGEGRRQPVRAGANDASKCESRGIESRGGLK